MAFYLLDFLAHDDREYDFRTIGVYATFSIALDDARKSATHEDDDWIIRKFAINRPCDGASVWSRSADDNRLEYAGFYARHWPGGFPKPA